MTETRHIKLEYNDAISAKKQLLSSEINLLNLVKKIRNYKILRKKELNEKNKLKISMGELKMKLGLLISTLPEQEKTDIRVKIKEKKIDLKKSKDMEDELKEIKQKLDKLK